MLVLIMLGFMVKPSVQLKSTHPLHAVVDTINHNGGPYIALVMTFPTEELVLLHSGLFLPNSNLPWIDLSGTATYSLSLSQFEFCFLRWAVQKGGSIRPNFSNGTQLQAHFLCVFGFSGRRFNIGKIRGVDVIYVMTGEQTVPSCFSTCHICDHCCLPIQVF